LWGIVATANFVASTAAHKGRGLQMITEFERQNSLGVGFPAKDERLKATLHTLSINSSP
jgi:hypothetical protein